MKINKIKLNEKKKQSDMYQVSYKELSALVRRAARSGYDDPKLFRDEVDALIENRKTKRQNAFDSSGTENSRYHEDIDYTKEGDAF